MGNLIKTRLSINLLFPRIFSSVAILVLAAISIIDEINGNTKPYEITQNCMLISIFIFVSVYSLFMTKVFYNAESIFIKKYKRKEEIFTFKDICSLNIKKYSTYNGISTFIMEYWDSQNFKEKIKFRANVTSSAMNDFIVKLKLINPSIIA